MNWKMKPIITYVSLVFVKFVRFKFKSLLEINHK